MPPLGCWFEILESVRESVRLPQVLAARATGRLAGLIATPAMDAYSLGLVLSMVLSRSCAPPFPDDAAAVEAATTRAPRGRPACAVARTAPPRTRRYASCLLLSRAADARLKCCSSPTCTSIRGGGRLPSRTTEPCECKPTPPRAQPVIVREHAVFTDPVMLFDLRTSNPLSELVTAAMAPVVHDGGGGPICEPRAPRCDIKRG